MIVDVNLGDNDLVIAVKGRLDTLTSQEFDKKVQNLDAIDRDIILDCAEMEYVSSAGLRSFISLLKRVKAAGYNMQVINLTPAVRPIFDMTGFSTLFNIK